VTTTTSFSRENKTEELTRIDPENPLLLLHTNSIAAEIKAFLFDNKYTTIFVAPGLIAMEPAESLRM